MCKPNYHAFSIISATHYTVCNRTRAKSMQKTPLNVIKGYLSRCKRPWISWLYAMSTKSKDKLLPAVRYVFAHKKSGKDAGGGIKRMLRELFQTFSRKFCRWQNASIPTLSMKLRHCLKSRPRLRQNDFYFTKNRTATHDGTFRCKQDHGFSLLHH